MRTGRVQNKSREAIEVKVLPLSGMSSIARYVIGQNKSALFFGGDVFGALNQKILTNIKGAPFQWATIFHKSDITFTKGADGLAFYSSTEKSREYMNPTKVSCSFCRTPIMDEGRNVCLLFPASIDYGETHEKREKWIKAFEVE